MIDTSNGCKVCNDYAFYVDKDTGMIKEQSSDNNQDLVPFFIPLSINNETIPFEIVFYDIGMNHCIFRFQGNFTVLNLRQSDKFGESNNFKYQSLDNALKGVSYA